MPLSTETIQNKPLSGLELEEVILRDVREVLDRDGMFSEYIAYGRVAYTVEISLHMANPSYSEHSSKATAKVVGVLEGAPPLAVVEGEQFELLTTREREIESPNLTRIAHGMPIKVTTSQGGSPVTRDLHYPKEDFEAPAPPVDKVKARK